MGAGAVAGPAIAAAIAGRFGFKAGLLAAFPVFALGIALPMVSAHFVALVVSSLIFGVMIPAIPALTSGRA